MDLPEVFEHGKKPVIAVDCDEVLGYFVKAMCSFHNEEYGTDHTPEDFFSYNFADVWECTRAESDARVLKFLNSPQFLDGIDIVPGAFEALKTLSERYDLVIVTSRQHAIADVTHQWVEQHYPGIFKSLLFGNHYGLSGDKKSKPDMCVSIHAEYLIDDALHYADQCAGHVKQAILFGDYAWNRTDEPLAEGITRCLDWSEVLTFFASQPPATTASH